MSRFIAIILVILLAFSACQKQSKPNVHQQKRYDLEQVIEGEINYLLSANKRLEKSLYNNGEEEKVILNPVDTAAWRQQFSSLIEANINKVAYLNAFKKEETLTEEGTQIAYTAVVKDTPVQLFVMKYQKDRLYAIDIVFMERNLVYTHIKEMTVYFDPISQHISSFTISGKEKMIFKSAFDYEVKANIV